jgi:predicted O-methyltransferase YrrM
VHGTDGDPANEPKALEYLGRAGLADPIRWHVGDAVSNLNAVDGTFDVVYNDIDKEGYPEAWRAARERVRTGGLYICDNVLWSGAAADPGGDHGRTAATTDAIREHNRLVADDERYVSSIVPTRDGVFVALRIA